ncbi:MAG: glycosyltransferase family 4 protein [Planctomycetes bacterium]|nr:glycosyltransferase family 4 protein [Planctomycetota bacterium]
MNSALRVGYVTKKFPRFSETFIVNEVLAQEELGTEVIVTSRRLPDDGRFHPSVSRLRNAVRYLSEGRSDALDQALRNCGAEVEDCFDRIPDALRFVRSHRLLTPLGLIAEAITLVAIARRERLAHLHAHFATDATTVAYLANLLSGIPYSFTAHAKDLYREGIELSLFRAKVDAARFVVTVCDANVKHIATHLAPGSATPILRLYNGVDLQLFAPGAESLQNPRKIVAIGRLVPKKGFEVLVDAAAELASRGSAFEMEILGDGELMPSLRARIAELGIGERVKLLGALPQNQVVEHLQGAAIGTLPCVVDSDGNRDALPTSLLESMGCGLPVVSTPVGGVPEIVVDGETGLLVPPGDASSLAQALQSLLEAPRRARAMGASARRRAEDLFDLHRNSRRLRGLFVASSEGAGADRVLAEAAR